MKRRRSAFRTISGVIVFLSVACSVTSSSAFETSRFLDRNIQEMQYESKNFIRDTGAERPLSIPPQPRDKHGSLKCTKNRYIQDERQTGMASWYGGAFHGKRTASGEVFNQNAFTLAHLTLPMGTEVLVENPKTGVSMRARVNDCGPFVTGRIADLSRGLAEKLGIVARGKGTVIITVL